MERTLPNTLRERMNDDGEVFIFHEWFQDYSSKMGTPSVALQLYDKDASRFVQTLENPGLRAAIQKYLETEATGDFWGSFNPDSCSWNQVFAELEDTKKVYLSKGAGNPIRRCFRHGQGFSRNMLPLLESIPQDDGLGLLKGGLQIIFNAVKRRTDTCEKIFASFEHIPICIINAERLRQIHPREEPLFTAISNLYDQLVKSIPLLIDVLLRKSNTSKMKQFGKSVFGDSMAEVESILKPVKSAETRLEQCRLDLNTRGIAENSHYLKDTHVKLDSLEQKFDIMEEKVETWRAEHKEMHRSLIDESLRQFVEDMKNSIYVACQDRLRVEWLSSETESNRALVPSRRLTIVDVMEAICNETERAAPLQDLALVLRKYHEFSPKALSQANYLMATPKFQAWLTSPESGMLLVDSHCGDQIIGKIAPSSVFCSGFVEALSGPLHDPSLFSLPHQPQVVLHFFTGQHTNPRAGLCGPHGLVRSLIDQLLLQWPEHEPLDLTFLEQEFSGRTTSNDFETRFLCYIFEQLVCQLSFRSTLFCVVDGLSHFETSLWGWADDLMMTIDSFLTCMHDGAGMVKFLLVSPERSTRVRHRIPENYHVDLRAGNFHARSPGQSLVVDITEMESPWRTY